MSNPNPPQDAPLIRNLPSENRARGISASRITDEDVRQRVDESFKRRNVREHLDRAAPLRQIVMGQEVERWAINGYPSVELTLHQYSPTPL